MIISRFYRRFVRHPKSSILGLLCYIFRVNKKKIVFCNFAGNGYSDNPKYIADEIIAEKVECQMVWLVRRYYEDIPKCIKQIKLTSLKGAYELSTAGVIVINTKTALPFFKKKNQYLIQTWHSTYGPKYVEKDAMDILPSKYIKDSIENSKETDLFISPCKLQTEEFRQAFWCKCEILPSGIPRNDIYFKYNSSTISSIKKKINIPNEAKVLIYAPTFRDNQSTDVYSILDFKKVRLILEQRFGGCWYILIRLHPGIKYKVNFDFSFDDRIINVSDYDDIQELLLISSVLITDYSSIMFDFYLLKKPVFLFIPDINSSHIRGLRPSFYDFPFEHCMTQDDLILSIESFDESKYLERINNFDVKFQSYDDGHASERVVDRIKRMLDKS